MKEEIARKWIEALRSEEYTQTVTGNLRIIDKDFTRYCCLGVLCVLAEKEGVKTDWEAFDHPPLEVQEWSGLDNENPRLQDPEDPENKVDAIHLNDIDEFSFPKIADWVETTYLKSVHPVNKQE